jgi:hypothetical protein
MSEPWVEAEKLREEHGDDIWAVDFTAHPLLDPGFPERPSRLLRFIELTWERIRADDRAYCHEMARLLQPLQQRREGGGGCPGHIAEISEYLREADVYICSAIRLLSPAARERVQSVRAVAECHDMRELLGLCFTSEDRRTRYEAQRKLYLAQLLLDIDHARHIQEGPGHKAYFEELLQDALWRHTRQVHEIQIGFHIDRDGESISYTSRPGPDDQIWTFHSIFLERGLNDRRIALDVLYYNCRFKRMVERVSFEIVDGRHRVLERLRWGEMRQQTSGSILSKMIRKGINNADEISDLIGAMFIVNDEESLNDLLAILDASIGNPFGWRNITDTLSGAPGPANLNRHSGRGYKVFKGDVDILRPGERPDVPPYRFQVEIQIYTLEAYLRTVCGSHEASHLALKLRQFLYGLVPRIFPRAVYGDDWLKLE